MKINLYGYKNNWKKKSTNKVLRIILVNIIWILLFQSQIISQAILDTNAEVEEIASGIQQPEGPVWNDSLGLLFSDIAGNKIYKWTSESGKEIYLNPSDSTNGLTYDLEGRLIAGQMGLRRIVRFEEDGSQTSLADKFEGKKFNSPNDLVVKSDGAIFFTDPDFNVPGGKKNKELTFNGIYRISPAGNLQLLATLALPNGICFSPDEKKLYVNDSQVHKIYVWDVVDDTAITNKKLFFTIPVNGYADGMKTDTSGNIYCTCGPAVWVISPLGEQLGKIDMPSNVSTSNCTWGDSDHKTLFITAGTSVYKVRPLVTAVETHGKNLPGKFKLFQNYPNPFNPSTIIEFYLPNREYMTLKINDITGRNVITLIEGEVSSGNHRLQWSTNGLASGIYFCRMKTKDYMKTIKMIFQK